MSLVVIAARSSFEEFSIMSLVAIVARSSCEEFSTMSLVVIATNCRFGFCVF